ncbi:MAG: hypothetical protein O2951_18870, partial [Bacteroidetes bacterium]|nr:hypothetical protein [Bacteroidota bacterium]
CSAWTTDDIRERAVCIQLAWRWWGRKKQRFGIYLRAGLTGMGRLFFLYFSGINEGDTVILYPSDLIAEGITVSY